MSRQLFSLVAADLRHELMETARAAPVGDLVEVGVYKGGTASALAEVAKEQARRLFLFDTFAGIPWSDPDKGDSHVVGDFGDATLAEIEEALPEAVCVPGIFPLTLADVDVGPIALAHIDCDQYRSVAACCEHLGPLMAPGGFMVFDDYHALEGARRAVEDCFSGRVEQSPLGVARVRF